MFRLPLPAILVLVPIFASPLANAQRTLQVPSQFSTVQSAINQASNGDTVSIAPGNYTGSISFLGKRITVQGSAAGVVLMPSAPGPVVSFVSGEQRASVLANVTIQGGTASTPPSAGGIFMNGSSPTLQGVTVQGSEGCGIAIISSAPAISNTVVEGTTFLPTDLGCLPASSQFGEAGGGIVTYGIPQGRAQASLTQNVIENNQSVYDSAGIFILDAGRPVLQNNIVRNNTSNGIVGSGQQSLIHCLWSMPQPVQPPPSITTIHSVSPGPHPFTAVIAQTRRERMATNPPIRCLVLRKALPTHTSFRSLLQP